MSDRDAAERRKITLERLANDVERLEWQRRYGQVAYRTAQIIAVLFGAATPILVLLDTTPTWAQALPAAIATVTASLSSLFRWRETWIHHATAKERLEAELLAFEVRSGERYDAKLSETEALGALVARRNSIMHATLAEWRTTVRQTPQDDEKPLRSRARQPEPSFQGGEA